LVATQRKLSEVLRSDFPWCIDHAEALGSIFGAYTERKRRRNVLDYDDLLLFWRALLVAPSVGSQVRSRFDHVLVDEFQDTNPIQADIVHAFGDGGATVTVVGDDAQAIYGFRNATVENMWAFPDRRAGTAQITLDQNYRSTMPILELANDVLLGEHAGADNPHFEKRLWSTRPGERRPRLVICADEQAQSVAVAERVLELREEGMALSDQAVLFRASHHSDLLEIELAARNIPFVKYGGLKFLEAAHVKDLLALLRILDNPRDELAWHRALKLLPGVGPGTVRRVLGEIGLDDESDPDRPLDEFLAGAATLPSAAGQAADVLRSALAECRGDAEVQPPPAVQIDRLREALAPLIEDRYDRAAVRLGDLEQLAVIASAYSQRQQLLTELVLDPPSSTGDLADEPHLDDDYLILSTIHSAKGGEWKAVHLIHAADGNLPSDMALNEKGGLDEERRLAYVALTRARDVLDVYVPLRYHHRRHGLDDAHNVAPLSRFLSPYRDRFDQVGTAAASALEQPVQTEARFGVADEVDSLLHGLWSE
jgi:DNA helicase-2/ATP-dependent DNA helicase PcrA